jgi:hypothetical protein
MKNTRNPAAGKIINRDHAIGLTDETDIEKRAREVASIEGHRAVNNDDRRQAQSELNGDDIPSVSDEDAQGISSLSRDPSEPASTPGRQIPDREGEDEQLATERLVAEGVNEAEHDQMVAARRKRRD